VGQVFRIVRNVKHCKSGKKRQETVYGISSLRPERADAGKIGEVVRGHWEIENRLHWVRDVTFDEDRSQVRTGSGPRILASLRNFTISCLRPAGFTNIAQGLRQLAWRWEWPLTLLGI
jgi:predicted transposase YbfD/YdcC